METPNAADDLDSRLSDFTNEDAIEHPEPAPGEPPAPEPEPGAAVEAPEGTNVKNATAAPAKGKTKKAAKPAKAPKAAKPAKAPKAAKGAKGKPGRASNLEGLKLFKPVLEKLGMQEGSRRMETYKGIKNGMKYETFVEGGGNRSDLARLIFHGRIEARKE